MPRVNKSDGEHCPICGHEIEVTVLAYNSEPFIDGRYYDQICFICNEVPQTYHFDEAKSELVVYPWRPDRLHTIELMRSEVGYDIKDKEEKKRVNKSIRSVKSAITPMNADTRSALIKASRAGEIRTFVDLTEPKPEVVDPKQVEPKEISKKVTKKRAAKKATKRVTKKVLGF